MSIASLHDVISPPLCSRYGSLAAFVCTIGPSRMLVLAVPELSSVNVGPVYD